MLYYCVDKWSLHLHKNGERLEKILSRELKDHIKLPCITLTIWAVLRKKSLRVVELVILQTCMRSHLAGPYPRLVVQSFINYMSQQRRLWRDFVDAQPPSGARSQARCPKFYKLSSDTILVTDWIR